MATLTGFEIAPGDDGYTIHFNTDDGQTIEIVASFEQLDLIAEEIDRLLDRDEEAALSADRADDA